MKTGVLYLLMAFVILLQSVACVMILRCCYIKSKSIMLEPVGTSVYRSENEQVLLREKGESSKRVVLIGDSRISRNGFSERIPEAQVLNRGIAGETTAQLLHRFEVDALALSPDVVLISTGVNDLIAASLIGEKGKAVALRVAENLKALAVRGATADVEVVLVTVVPPAEPELLRRLVWNSTVYQYVREVNEQLLSWSPPEKIAVLSHAIAFGKGDVMPSEFSADTLHFNRNGYERFNYILFSAVRSALARKRERFAH